MKRTKEHNENISKKQKQNWNDTEFKARMIERQEKAGLRLPGSAERFRNENKTR